MRISSEFHTAVGRGKPQAAAKVSKRIFKEGFFEGFSFWKDSCQKDFLLQLTQVCPTFYGIHDVHIASVYISERFDMRSLHICVTQVVINDMHCIRYMDKEHSFQMGSKSGTLDSMAVMKARHPTTSAVVRAAQSRVELWLCLAAMMSGKLMTVWMIK